MCTTKRRSPRAVRAKRSKQQIELNNNMEEEREYLQLEETDPEYDEKDGETHTPDRRLLEKTVFVLTTLTVVWLSHAIVWAQWSLPLIYTTATPTLILVKLVIYWKNKWQYFMLDFCYWANFLTLLCLWLPENGYLFRTVFAITNGPILMAAIVWRNSLVYHHHDKVTSAYIHVLPPIVTFSIRWFPVETSRFWFQSFVSEMPDFDPVWLYLAPFGFFFLHSLCYCLIINVVVCPRDPYITSYSYLAVKYHKLNRLDGPVGQGISYYGLNWLFGLTTLLLPLAAYQCFTVHCLLLLLVFVVVVWNGASYYVHVFSERGFQGLN